MIEQSFGIIPCRKVKGKREFLLVQHSAGHWGFPKGHALEGEAPLQAAVRELKEETSLEVVDLYAGQAFCRNLCTSSRIGEKGRILFGNSFRGCSSLDPVELVALGWFPESEVADRLTFKAGKELWQEVLIFIDESF